MTLLRWLRGARGAVHPGVLVAGGVAASAVAVVIALAAPGGGGPCALTTPNVPDGPDPFGTCWPGPSNTGPNASQASMAAYTGSCDLTSPNVTIDSKVINCQPLRLESTASGLTVTNSYVNGGLISDNGASFTLQDSELDNAIDYAACTSPSSCAAGKYACGDPGNATVDCGVGYKNYTILRTEVKNTNRGAWCQSNCLIQDSYFHGTTLWPDHTNLAHASGVRNEQFMTLQHSVLACDYQGPFPNGELGCSADMSGYPDFVPIHDDTIRRNLFIANPQTYFEGYGGCTQGKPFSGDPANCTNIKFIENVFQKGFRAGGATIADFNSSRSGNAWTGNLYDDGTTALDPS